MTQSVISWIPAVAAGLIYLAVGTRVVRGMSGSQTPEALKALRWPALGAALLHLVAVGMEMFGPGVIHFGFGLAVSVAMLLAVAITLVESWVRKVSGLMGILLIVAAAGAVMPVFFSGETVLAETWSYLFRFHLLAALAAYSFMTIAFVQAVLLALLQRQLKDPAAATESSGLVANLPNLMAMERILYRIVLLGFVCLTLVLVLGAFATNDAYGQFFVFDHKTVLSWMAWIVFAVLLVGRYFFGWRNKQARAWFWAGYAILVVAYLVYRLVFELFLV